MSAYEVKDALVAELNKKKFDFICLNFANGDMVGHTGVYDAIIKAVKAAFILHIRFPRFLFFLPEMSLQSKKSR